MINIGFLRGIINMEQIPAGFSFLVCPAGDGNPRNTEGSILELKDGRLLLAYTCFIGGADDSEPALIMGKYSVDEGRSWGESFVVQENIGRENVMSVTLLRLQSDDIAMFYLVKNSSTDLHCYMKISRDETQSWSEPVCVTSGQGYHVVNNDRVIQLDSGRLVVPVASTPDCDGDWHFKSLCYLSDDDGKTWTRSNSVLDLPKRGAMEPGVAECPDGSLLMIIRNQLGWIYTSRSFDEGENWSEPEATTIPSPESPATLQRIPGTDDLLMVWNNNLTCGTQDGLLGRRTPLTASVSKDGGKTWGPFKDIETDPNHTFAYTSITFVNGNALLSYYDSPEWTPLSLRFTSIPMKWFYA